MSRNINLDQAIGRLIDKFDENVKVPKYAPKRRTWATPQELQVLCSYIVDRQSLPAPFSWGIDEVVKFIAKLGFPEYEETFRVNMINGRTLLLVDAAALCHMNIKLLDHILIITRAIRDLYAVENVLFIRSISLPPRYPDTHYKYYRVCTGPKYENCKRTDLWRSMKILRDKKVPRNHFDKLEDWLQHRCCHKRERFGAMSRYNMYYVRPCPFTEADFIVCNCIPPCECRWDAEHDTRPPWKLSFLTKFSKQHHYFDRGESLTEIVIPLAKLGECKEPENDGECEDEVVVIPKDNEEGEDPHADDATASTTGTNATQTTFPDEEESEQVATDVEINSMTDDATTEDD